MKKMLGWLLVLVLLAGCGPIVQQDVKVMVDIPAEVRPTIEAAASATLAPTPATTPTPFGVEGMRAAIFQTMYTCEVIVDRLWVRPDASMEQAGLGIVYRGDVLTVGPARDGWRPVMPMQNYPQGGWIAAEYCEVAK